MKLFVIEWNPHQIKGDSSPTLTIVCHLEKIISCKLNITKQRNYILVKRNERYMNNLNIFVVLSIVAASSSLFVGTMVTSVLAVSHDNMTMSMDNSSMPTHNMSDTTMSMDNSTTGMTDNATIAVN